MIYLLFVLMLFERDNFYIGKGVAHYSDKITKEEAIEHAKTRARESLAKNIRVRIKTTITRIIAEEAETVSERLKKLVEEKTEVVLDNVEYDEPIIDEDKKTITITARISKEKYQQSVEEDLKRKKSRIIFYYKEAEKNLKKGLYTFALKSLYRARRWIWLFFKDLPINGDLNGDGIEDEELKAGIQSKIDGLIGRLTFESVNKELLFTSTGNVIGTVGFHIYWEKEGVLAPVKNFPLYAYFVKGKGKITIQNVITDNTGYAELEVEDIDPSYNNVVIKIIPDIEKFFPSFPSEESDEAKTQLKKELGVIPEWNINIQKKKTLVLSVYAVSGEKKLIPSNIREDVKGIIRAKGYDVVVKNILDRPDIEAIRNLKRQGIDYICIVKITVHSKYIQDFELYVARASGLIKLYSSIEGAEVQSIPVGSTDKKFALDRSTAVWNAIGSLRGSITKKVRLLRL